MHKVISIIWKDTIRNFSSWTQLLFFLVLPIIFTVLLSGALFNVGAADAMPLLLVNEDDGDLAQTLVTTLAENSAVALLPMDREAAQAAFADEEAPALVIIPAGFGAGLLAGETAVLHVQQLPNSNNAQIGVQAVQTAVNQLSRPILAARASVAEAERMGAFASSMEREAYFQDSLALAQQRLADTPARVERRQPENAVESNGFDLAAHQSAGQLITWVFIPLLGTSVLLVAERRLGTLRRMLSTPTMKGTFLIGTLSGQFLLALVQMTLLIIFGVFVLDVAWGREPLGLVVLLPAFALAAVALGTMLGTFVKTESQANNLSIMLGMAMAMLGGCWQPLELFPPFMQTAALALPTTWAMQGLSDMLLRGQGAGGVFTEAAVLVGFAAVFLAVGIGRFRYE